MGINHYYPTMVPHTGEEAICGHILTTEPEPADCTQFQQYCVACLKAVFEVENGTLFAESDI